MEFVIKVWKEEIESNQEIHREFGVGKSFALEEDIYVISWSLTKCSAHLIQICLL